MAALVPLSGKQLTAIALMGLGALIQSPLPYRLDAQSLTVDLIMPAQGLALITIELA